MTETSKTLKKVPDEENPITTCYFKKSVRNEEGIIEKRVNGNSTHCIGCLFIKLSKSVKRQIKKESESDKVKVLDGLQLAYKVTANSVYGQLGFKQSTMLFKKSLLLPHQLVENIFMMRNEVSMNGLDRKIYRNQTLCMVIQIRCCQVFQEPILRE